ncbi:trypsin-like peptidase domain-containing protein [Dyadobacter psychrotolerans]|uniref:PDZ domain-containing protein n=1 Tax=Dyadobacter psychrotolerans TaxID=2541721 RepID=A0A4R5DZJ5_9BACT|nr:trypsin-like peptidase domain-containing protein [Dyadobacter psychrotolerans]TDE18124.1 PDZ domain-containing protein [Dyadobacter psychrotolerans]
MKRYSGFLLSALLVTLQASAAGCENKESPATGVSGITQIISQDTLRIDRSKGTVSFVAAAKAAMPAVVHIKIRFNSMAGYGASGSGVIISEDGYIATNNHVVEKAEQIDVTLPDKRTFRAKLIGRDPNTDLALIKVEARNLPVVKIGDSDAVQIGEWVLAIGFPLSLNTTVTAGIVSAKARSIGIINRNGQSNPADNQQPMGSTAVESFIQTDAAINPGNSGGALVNADGELIGINSAIASQTGSYAGYAFAIPVNLAKKILEDLKAFGSVKRGVLGVSFPAPSAEDQYIIQQGLNPANIKGVYLTGVQPESAASAAGLREGDIIQSIDGISLNSSTEFSERIARHKPDDVIKLGYLRKGKTGNLSVTLKGEGAEKSAPKLNRPLELRSKLGATFAPLTEEIKQRFSLNAGVQVTNVRNGGFFDQIGIPSGTVIAFINGQSINNPGDIDDALISAQNGIIRIFAIAPDGSKVVFDFSLGT